MLIGILVLVVLILVIVTVMSSSSLSDKNGGSKYIAEAKKVAVMMNDLKGAAQFYYTNNESYAGIDMNYFKGIHFYDTNMVDQDPSGQMIKDNWTNWPPNLEDPYTGPYLELGGTPGDQMRIIVAPIGEGETMGVYLMKNINSTFDPQYSVVLEKVLSTDPDYLGG